MLGERREEQLKKAFDAGLIPLHVANALRTEMPLLAAEADLACTAISAGYEDGECEYRELYQYILCFSEII